MTTLFVLLIIFQFKHWLCDFPLQTEYMLGKFKPKDWALPLSAHAGVHALFTNVIVLWFLGNPEVAVALAAFDFVCHFSMDRVKASSALLGRYKALSSTEYAGASTLQRRGNVLFWWSLGFDQMVHHFTHYAIIGVLLYATK